jgi:hypothetical protein
MLDIRQLTAGQSTYNMFKTKGLKNKKEKRQTVRIPVILPETLL